MGKRTPDMRQSSAGFSLIEITFAILLLAASLTVLLGLQSSSVSRSVRDSNRQQAMLISREILTVLESAKDTIENQNIEGTADEVYKETAALSEIKGDRKLDPEGRFKARLEIGTWKIEKVVEDDSLKKVELTVYWSDLAVDSFIVTYFKAEPPPPPAP